MSEIKGETEIIYGWRENKTSKATHYYKSRTGYKLGMSACGLVIMLKNMSSTPGDEHCPICQIKQELESDE